MHVATKLIITMGHCYNIHHTCIIFLYIHLIIPWSVNAQEMPPPYQVGQPTSSDDNKSLEAGPACGYPPQAAGYPTQTFPRQPAGYPAQAYNPQQGYPQQPYPQTNVSLITPLNIRVT